MPPVSASPTAQASTSDLQESPRPGDGGWEDGLFALFCLFGLKKGLPAMRLSKTTSPWAGLIHGGPRFKASASFSNTQAKHLEAPSRCQHLLTPARRAPCPRPRPGLLAVLTAHAHVKQRELSGRAAKCFLGCQVLNSRHGRCGHQQQLDRPCLWPLTGLHSCHPRVAGEGGGESSLLSDDTGGYKGEKSSQK